MQIILKPPIDCTADELQTFYSLVLEGGQVNKNGLMNRIKRASILAFAKINYETVGIASLKKPNQKYKIKVFTKAGVTNLINTYTLELGYVVVLPTYRGNRISKELIKTLLKYSPQNVFATTKNDTMKHVLHKLHFKKEGTNYKNENGELLELFISQLPLNKRRFDILQFT